MFLKITYCLRLKEKQFVIVQLGMDLKKNVESLRFIVGTFAIYNLPKMYS